MKRPGIDALLKLGPFPSEQNVNIDVIRQQQTLVEKIKPPTTDEEAKALLCLLGPDDYFGVAWTVLHLIESAPGWPILECLTDTSNEWVLRLKNRSGI